MKKRVICLVGRCCSGKTQFAETLINHHLMDIGSIVRKLKKNQSRVFDKTLDEQIIKHLEYGIDQFPVNYVITGIRQLSILQFLINKINKEDLELIYLSVPEEILKRRYISREDQKDEGFSFEEVIRRDSQLGLGEVEDFIKSNPTLFTIIQNY